MMVDDVKYVRVCLRRSDWKIKTYMRQARALELEQRGRVRICRHPSDPDYPQNNPGLLALTTAELFDLASDLGWSIDIELSTKVALIEFIEAS